MDVESDIAVSANLRVLQKGFRAPADDLASFHVLARQSFGSHMGLAAHKAGHVLQTQSSEGWNKLLLGNLI